MFKKLLFILLLPPAAVCAQTKGDTKIIVSVKDTANLLNRLGAVLFERGYEIKSKDLGSGFLSTEEREASWGWLLKGRFLIKGDTLIITGRITGKELDATKRQDFGTLTYGKSEIFRYYNDAWKELEDIGRQFGTLSYSK